MFNLKEEKSGLISPVESHHGTPRSRARFSRSDIKVLALTALLCATSLVYKVAAYLSDENVFSGFPRTYAYGCKGASGHLDYAHRILASNPLIDGHNDLLIRVRLEYANHIYASNFTDSFTHSGGFPGEVDLPRIDEGSYGGAFWSAFWVCQDDIFDFSDDAYRPIVSSTLSQLDLFQRLREEYPNYFAPTPDVATAKSNFANGKLISPLAIEGLHQIGNSFSTLRLYYALGVRYATLTWNCHNRYADAALLTFIANRSTVAATPYWGGISRAGRVAVAEMNRLGMLVDISHVSQDTMRDVLIGEHNFDAPHNDVEEENVVGQGAWIGSIAPPIFSHSSAYAICPHPRNVPDSILRLVKQRNSIVMVNITPEFISCSFNDSSSAESGSWLASESKIPDFYPANNTVHQVARHIVHIGELIGYSYVGIGTDFDGLANPPKGLEDVSKLPNLIAELLRMGVSEENVIKVAGKNILRVWDEVDRIGRKLRFEGYLPAEDDLQAFG